jgi:apyrase
MHIPLNASHVAAHLLPAFEYAAEVIPEQYHSTTGVKYQATAGMRLLDIQEQEAVYDALYDGLLESETFVFSSTRREDISTLGGDLEGFYGAVAANYLKGVIDIKLQTVGVDDHGPLGALDMGGSSTQIVYLPAMDPCDNPETCIDNKSGIPSKLDESNFFSTSYLAYGVDQFRERLWDTWIEERKVEDETFENACADRTIFNPCFFKGYELEWQGYTLLGTGSAHECVQQVQKLIPHHEDVTLEISPGSRVGGVEHPPLRGKFFAMSLYYFALDSLRVLSHPHVEAHEALNVSWPTPSIEELYNALEGLCSRSWQGVSTCECSDL